MGFDPFGGTTPTGWDFYILSTAAGDMNWTISNVVPYVSPETRVVADGAGLPAGQFIRVFGPPPYPSIARGEGQVVLHSGANVTAVTFHAISIASTRRCQLTGVATPGI
jgi:hypothetical protein